MTGPEKMRFKVSGRMVLRRIGEDRLLVPITGDLARANAVFPLNETGAVIWECISAGKTLEDASREVSRRFMVDDEAAMGDCVDFVKRLEEKGLIEAAVAGTDDE
jgi:hypothetical protein